MIPSDVWLHEKIFWDILIKHHQVENYRSSPGLPLGVMQVSSLLENPKQLIELRASKISEKCKEAIFRKIFIYKSGGKL